MSVLKGKDVAFKTPMSTDIIKMLCVTHHSITGSIDIFYSKWACKAPVLFENFVYHHCWNHAVESCKDFLTKRYVSETS